VQHLHNTFDDEIRKQKKTCQLEFQTQKTQKLLEKHLLNLRTVDAITKPKPNKKRHKWSHQHETHTLAASLKNAQNA
jgi:hypothetical protein